MVRNIYVNKMTTKAVGEQQTEYVERKGIGHPDSLIDGIVDETSHALSREYLRRSESLPGVAGSLRDLEERVALFAG